MSTALYKCKWCKKEFTARTADRARGWARFCSKSCKAMKQENRTGATAAFRQREERRNPADLDNPTFVGCALSLDDHDPNKGL